ncbi:hypothetical protein Hbl1158_05270 [Halobaculum sp. CBA1158]|uniref:DUF7504 family protein n=1 Tax=Halobaculum sp. CBA1158 TaxID=2904243 RepID=UPI001F275152|nr:hypothetical protein [Halobaculum sp. CBA1158]UIP00771.1 hypothetical protein Hbl1158_05270 [Halobaculum sp. CBA1158]
MSGSSLEEQDRTDERDAAAATDGAGDAVDASPDDAHIADTAGDDTERPRSARAELVLTPPGPERRAMLKRQAVTGYVEHPTVVEFSYETDPATLHERWRESVGSPPCHMVVDATGSGEVPGPRVAADGGSFAAEAAHPQDLTGLCMKWQDALEEARGRGDLFVAFDSVTALLQYVDLREAYRFLHTLVAGVHQAGARAQFYLDPDAHDEQTVSTVQGLFDAVRRIG